MRRTPWPSAVQVARAAPQRHRAGGANGRPGGVGPCRDAGTTGAGGDGNCGSFGGGGGGGGFPFGGAATQPYGGSACNGFGGGGQSYAPGGWTAVGSDSDPGNAGDPERPLEAGRGGAGLTGPFPALPGAVVYRVIPADWIADPFAFSDLDGLALGARVESEPQELGGFDGPARVLVVGEGGPEVSIAGQAWASEGQIHPGESLTLRQTASAEPATARSALLLVGAATVEWTVSTAPEERPEPRRLAVALGCAVAGSGAPLQSASGPGDAGAALSAWVMAWIAMRASRRVRSGRRSQRVTGAGGSAGAPFG